MQHKLTTYVADETRNLHLQNGLSWNGRIMFAGVATPLHLRTERSGLSRRRNELELDKVMELVTPLYRAGPMPATVLSSCPQYPPTQYLPPTCYSYRPRAVGSRLCPSRYCSSLTLLSHPSISHSIFLRNGGHSKSRDPR